MQTSRSAAEIRQLRVLACVQLSALSSHLGRLGIRLGIYVCIGLRILFAHSQDQIQAQISLKHFFAMAKIPFLESSKACNYSLLSNAAKIEQQWIK